MILFELGSFKIQWVRAWIFVLGSTTKQDSTNNPSPNMRVELIYASRAVANSSSARLLTKQKKLFDLSSFTKWSEPSLKFVANSLVHFVALLTGLESRCSISVELLLSSSNCWRFSEGVSLYSDNCNINSQQSCSNLVFFLVKLKNTLFGWNIYERRRYWDMLGTHLQ